MRALVLLALLLPSAAAWGVTIDAPATAASGLPFEARVCIEAPADARVEVKADLMLNGTRVGQSGRAGRYAPASAGCSNLTIAVKDVEGPARLEVKARPEGGDAKARAAVDVRLVRAPVTVDDAGARMADGPTPRLVLVDAWPAPWSGVTLRNDGDAAARLLHHRLGAAELPDETLAPGESAFVGARAPPGAERWLRADVRFARDGVTLTLAERVLDAIGAPNASEKRGIATLPAVPMRVEGRITALVTPDAGVAPIVELLRAARAEVLLEGYQLTSAEIGAALLDTLDRGAAVRVLLEGAPVGGVPEEESALVAALLARGADVRWMEGAPARFRTQHAKLIVVDETRALVSSENFRSSSFPAVPTSLGTRGYALVVENATLARALAGIVRADAAPWPDVRAASSDELPPPVAPPAMPAADAGPTLTLEGAWNVTPILSPGGAAPVVAAMAGARGRIDAAVLFAEPRGALVDALVDAARRNVTVRLLLDGNVDDGKNAATAARLNAIASRESLPLVARVDDAPRTLHAKLVLIDGRAAYVGSMNWGRASVEDNREAGLLVENATLAAWLAPWFERDWEEEGAAAAPGRLEVPGAAAWMVVVALTSRLRSRASRRR